MEGEDVMEVKVYKERREHWKKGQKKRKETKGRTLRREKVNSSTFYVNSVSSGALV